MKVAIFAGNRSAAYRVVEYILGTDVEVVAVVYEGEQHGQLYELCKKNDVFTCNSAQMYKDLENGTFPEFQIGISYLYNKILKPEIIEYAKNQIINFHPAPTQVHRGIAACCYCILHGYKEWGVTAHVVTSKIDDGDILQQHNFKIDPSLTGFEAERFIQNESFSFFCRIFEDIIHAKETKTVKQEQFLGTYYSRNQLEKDKKIKSDDDTDLINKKIQTFWFPPYHGAYIEINGQKYTLVNEDILKRLAGEYK